MIPINQPLVKATCFRCGKEILTANISGIIHRESYKKYGRICNSCLSEKEREEYIMAVTEETRIHALKYIPSRRRMKWGSWEKELTLEEEVILRTIMIHYFHTGNPPTLYELEAGFPHLEVYKVLSLLIDKGIIKAKC